jgi:hypothetical protein
MLYKASRHKVLVIDFDELGQRMHNSLSALEFIEFFCRLAIVRYDQTDYERLELYEKVE